MTSNKIKNLIRGLISPKRLWLSWETTIMAMLATSAIIAISPLARHCAIALPRAFRSHVSVISTVTYSLNTKSVHLAKSSFPDGIYLYGNSPTPEQIGQEYIVFQVRQGQVVGAFYLPQSEFNCFQGKLDATQLTLKMLDPDELTNTESEFAFRPNSQASSSQSLAAFSSTGSHLSPNERAISNFHQVNLETYYPITQISNNDRRIIAACLDFQNQ
ncbi:MAG: hypothetical protein QNJ41_28620 [Xenococcaceae cyanobacterium MO_188.B32]|nr:hypothetical protein [Xenococcaceae cyanobacterium MO_188.B32]